MYYNNKMQKKIITKLSQQQINIKSISPSKTKNKSKIK
jgi:hypothetical protein